MQCQRLKFKLSTALKFWVQFPNPQLKVIPGPAYYTKEIKQLIQMLEADHLSPSREFNFPKLFQNDKYFESNDVSKTLKFYEFILVDTKFVQFFHIQNIEGTDIAYSKCKILKIISKNDLGQNHLTHKRFSQNFVPQTFDYLNYKEA